MTTSNLADISDIVGSIAIVITGVKKKPEN